MYSNMIVKFGCIKLTLNLKIVRINLENCYIVLIIVTIICRNCHKFYIFIAVIPI